MCYSLKMIMDSAELLKFQELIENKRKSFEKNEPSDGSDVASSLSSSRAEDTDDEEKLHRPGGYCNPKENEIFFNKYKILDKLGRGHFSTVWRVEEMQKKKNYAMKIQKSAKSYRESAMEEIQFHHYLSNKKHDGMKYINLMLYNNAYKGPFGKHICMVFELFDSDLSSYARTFPGDILGKDLTSLIAYQILHGLEAIHAFGVIHSDLKLENIVVKKKDTIQVQIADFGTACVLGDRSMDYLQTSHYRSPDIILQYKNWGTPIDIWSAACIFFELLTGEYLFDGENEEDLIVAMIEVLGRPRSSFVGECKNRRRFFTKDGKLVPNLASLNPLPLNRVLSEEHSYSRYDSEAICKLLLPMLEFCPMKRATATELLKLYPQA